MPYFVSAGKEPEVLILGILIIAILIMSSVLIINIKCQNFKIKIFFYLALLIQILILIIDNYIVEFPTLELDSRAFEALGWKSYEQNINIGRGAYNYYIINPIYKILKVRVAIIFGALNIFFNMLINLNIYEILKILKVNKNGIKFLMILSLLSPISLIFRSGILREAIVILFLSYSLKSFINYILNKKEMEIFKAIIYVGIGALFHGGVIFMNTGYLISLIIGKKNKRGYQFIILGTIFILFLTFKDRLLMKVGGGDIEKILRIGNSEFLRTAGSAYLEGADMSSLSKLIIYLPLKIYYFLFSPTPDMVRGIIDIGVFMTNSLIYIFLICNILKLYFIKNIKLEKIDKDIIKYLMISFVVTVIVFSVGTHNAGTAMRHRDKVLPSLIIMYGILKSRRREYVFRENI